MNEVDMTAPGGDRRLTAQEFRELEERVMMRTGRKLPVTFVRGEGVHLYDSEGREYLDLMAGIAVNALGHAHAAVVEAIVRQAQSLIHASDLYYTEPKVWLAERLVSLAFPGRVYLNNSGAEANETAIKLSRKWGRLHRDGAHEIITMLGSFHGRTMATLSATGQPHYQAPYAPLVPTFRHVPFNDLEAVRAATGPATVAVMVEPVMGEVGIIPAAAGYLRGLRDWCDEQNLLLIFDEIQTGIGRTGHWFAFQHYGVTPDVMTLAKALGGGLPLAACIANPRADVFEPGDHGSTYGGNPVACAAALAVLDVIAREGLLDHVREVGDMLAETLDGLGQGPSRGLGLMRAFDFEQPVAKAFQDRALDAGVVVNAVNEHTIRVEPPLILQPADVDEARTRLHAAVKAL